MPFANLLLKPDLPAAPSPLAPTVSASVHYLRSGTGRSAETSKADAEICLLLADAKLASKVKRALAGVAARVTAFDNAIEFQQACELPFDGVAIIDARLPGLDGLSLYRWMRDQGSTAGAIFVSAKPDVALTVQCMKAGAESVFALPLDMNELKASVLSALAAARRRSMGNRTAQARQTVLASLTPAERKVMALLLEGHLTKQIAAILGRSEYTIKIHRGRILRKMGVSSTTALIKFFLDDGSGEPGTVALPGSGNAQAGQCLPIPR